MKRFWNPHNNKWMLPIATSYSPVRPTETPYKTPCNTLKCLLKILSFWNPLKRYWNFLRHTRTHLKIPWLLLRPQKRPWNPLEYPKTHLRPYWNASENLLNTLETAWDPLKRPRIHPPEFSWCPIVLLECPEIYKAPSEIHWNAHEIPWDPLKCTWKYPESPISSVRTHETPLKHPTHRTL